MITNESSPPLQQLSDESPEPKGPTEHGSAAIPQVSLPTWQRWESWLGVLIAFGIWLASVVSLLLVPLVFVVPYVVYLYVAKQPMAPEAVASDKTILFLSILGVIPAHAVTFLIVWLTVRAFWPYLIQTERKSFWKVMGFEWPRSFGPTKGFVTSAMIAVVLLAIGLLITKLFGGTKTDLDILIESSTGARVATAVIAFATAPLIEELIYRGVLYSALERAMGMVAAVAIVSFLFTAVHYIQYRNNLAVVAVIGLLSLCLTIVRALSKKLLPSFVIHMVFNGIQSLVLLFQPTEASPKTPGIDLLISFLHRLI